MVGSHHHELAFVRGEARYAESRKVTVVGAVVNVLLSVIKIVAGWLGGQQQGYFDEQKAKLERAGLAREWEFLGTVSRAEKIEILKQLDLFSVPTTYQEPKGLYVLEALAAGVPVVLPGHGAFPEMLEQLGGGLLVEPGDSTDLARAGARLLRDKQLATRLGSEGQVQVCRQRNLEAMASATLETLSRFT